jgi:hypothetical protein
VMTDTAVCELFGRVNAALEPGGPFVFDVNTDDAYRCEWSKSSAVIDDDAVHIVRGEYDEVNGIGYTDITMFRPADPDTANDGSREWQRVDLRVAQRSLAADRLAPMLEAAGFVDVKSVCAPDAGMRGDIAVGRLFMTARRC